MDWTVSREMVDVAERFPYISSRTRYAETMLRMAGSVLRSGCLPEGIGSLTEYLSYFQTSFLPV